MIAQTPMLDERKTGYSFLAPVYKKGKWQAWHCGEDLNSGNSASADFKLEIKPMAKGKVIYSRNAGIGWGNLLVIWHEELKVWSRYAHFYKVNVKEGDEVDLNTVIGLCGKSGTGSVHCHWEVIIKHLPGTWTLYPNGWNKKKVLEYWTSPYEFLNKINMTTPQVSEFAKESFDKAKNKLANLKLDNPQQIIGDATVEQIFIDLDVFSQKVGNVTKERFLVALDRLGLLGK